MSGTRSVGGWCQNPCSLLYSYSLASPQLTMEASDQDVKELRASIRWHAKPLMGTYTPMGHYQADAGITILCAADLCPWVISGQISPQDGTAACGLSVGGPGLPACITPAPTPIPAAAAHVTLLRPCPRLHAAPAAVLRGCDRGPATPQHLDSIQHSGHHSQL